MTGSILDMLPLRQRLCRLSPLDRAHLVATLATAAEPERRLELADALDAPMPGIGIRTALDHLRRDPSPAVRTAAARAWWRHGGVDGPPPKARVGSDVSSTGCR